MPTGDQQGIGTKAVKWVATGDIRDEGQIVAGQIGYQKYPFSHIFVDSLLRGNTEIFWYLDSGFNEDTPWNFTVQWAVSGDSSWVTVGTTQDTFTLIDTTQREYTKLIQGFYRVKLETNDGNIYYSLPSRFPTSWVIQDLKWAEEIKRKEELVNNKIGLSFWILCRKEWGTDCSCIDPITGEIKNTKCTTCYGTGFEGGYFPPYYTNGRSPSSEQQQIVQTQLGTLAPGQLMLRYCPFPAVHEKDIIITKDQDKRYVIDKVQNAAEIKGIPIVQHLKLSPVPVSSILYDLKTSWGGAGPTGAVSSEWNK